MEKIYVLDTNILMQTYGEALVGFEDNCVIVTGTTLEELDHLKTAPGEKGYSARCVIRMIQKLIDGYDATKSIPLDNEGYLRFYTQDVSQDTCPRWWNMSVPDNRIIASARELMRTNKGIPVILITNDVLMQIKAESIGIRTQDYHNDTVKENELSSGKVSLTLPGSYIDSLYSLGRLPLQDVPVPDFDPAYGSANLYIKLIDEDNPSHTGMAIKRDGELQALVCKKKDSYMGIRPKNLTQTYAIDALKAPASEIPLVILRGPAGCGKTLLATAVGMSKTLDGEYAKLVISRSNTLPDGEDLGFLPGSIESKMSPLLAPFYDNLSVMLQQGSRNNSDKMEIDEYLDSGIIEIAPLAYIRGRSIPNSYIIIDEAQNLTKNQVKTIVTRTGANTKIVLCGDPDQIDSPKLTRYTNGLVYASKMMKDDPLCIQLEFDFNECERSPLATTAAEKFADVN